MPHTPSARRGLAVAAALVALGLVAGCSEDDESPRSTSSARDDAPASPATTATDPATDPNGPFVVAASAVASRSLDQVTQLHVMGTGTVGESELPRDQIPGLAGAIEDELGRQVQDATMMTPPKGSAAARLVAALGDYRTLASELAEWRPARDEPMPAAWFDELRRADRDWRAALRELGELSGEDLLGNVPDLMMPA